MTELPEEVRRELEELLGDNIPSYAVTMKQIVAADNRKKSYKWWHDWMMKEIEAGTWTREKQGHTFLYWPVKGEGTKS
jgi:hypothetical protein